MADGAHDDKNGGTDMTRAPRHTETRSAEAREVSWRPPSMLPDPDPRPGWRHRWVRASTLGASDPTNISASFRGGWTPVLAKEYPEMQVLNDPHSRFKGNIEVGGLILCRQPEEVGRQRDAYYANLAETQHGGVHKQYLSNSDSRMPKLKPEVRSRVTFGAMDSESIAQSSETKE